MPFKQRFQAFLVAVLCLALTVYFSGTFLNLSFAIADHRGGTGIRIVVGIVIVLLQLLGGVAAGVTIRFDDGSIRTAVRNLPTLALGFFSVAALCVILATYVAQPANPEP